MSSICVDGWPDLKVLTVREIATPELHTLPPIIMEVENGCISNIRVLSFRVMFHFHDYGRKGIYIYFFLGGDLFPSFKIVSKISSLRHVFFSWTWQISMKPTKHTWLPGVGSWCSFGTMVAHGWGCLGGGDVDDQHHDTVHADLPWNKRHRAWTWINMD